MPSRVEKMMSEREGLEVEIEASSVSTLIMLLPLSVQAWTDRGIRLLKSLVA